MADSDSIFASLALNADADAVRLMNMFPNQDVPAKA